MQSSLMGEIVKETAEATKENDSLGCAKAGCILQCTG